MNERNELNTAIGFEEFLVPEKVDSIVDSYSFKDGKWRELTRITNFPENVTKTIVPVDISSAKFMVLTEAVRGTKVGHHTHAEPILRIVVEGSFVLNGKIYKQGDWVLVPAGLSYEMSTENGYITLAGYGVACDQ